jgi:hypothetical protein
MNVKFVTKKAEQSLKSANTTPSSGKIMASGFWNSQFFLSTDFLTEQCTINAAYYSKLLKDPVKPAFRSKRRGRSAKSVCLLHDKARPHIVVVTSGTLEEMHWEVLPHPACSSDLASSDFHLCLSLKEALGGKRFRANNEVKLLCNDGWTSNNFLRGIIKLPERWRRCIEVQDEYVQKLVLCFGKHNCFINFIKKILFIFELPSYMSGRTEVLQFQIYYEMLKVVLLH